MMQHVWKLSFYTQTMCFQAYKVGIVVSETTLAIFCKHVLWMDLKKKQLKHFTCDMMAKNGDFMAKNGGFHLLFHHLAPANLYVVFCRLT
jgi:hypothetical protein